MSLPWVVAVMAMLVVGVLGGLYWRQRARLALLEQQARAAQEDLKAQLARLNQLRDGVLQAVDDALLVLDGHQKIVFANPTAEAMLGQGLAGETLIGALRHPELEALLSDARILHGDSVERRVEIDRHVIRAHAVAFGEGERTFEVLTLRDVTELQQLERSRREMVSNVTHELSHPITAIGLLADTLINVALKEKPKRIRKMAQDIRREADTLTQLVQEMRDLSLIESGQMPVRMTSRDLQVILQSAVEQLLPLAENKQQTIDLSLPGQFFVLADDLQIVRAIRNILHNAIKFAPEGGKIYITATQNDGEAIIAIRDNGPGIPAEDLTRIFERFFQVDRARREGTGLGLAIVRHIVRAHGGRIWAESMEGEGATFYIALALAEEQPPVPAVPAV